MQCVLLLMCYGNKAKWVHAYCSLAHRQCHTQSFMLPVQHMALVCVHHVPVYPAHKWCKIQLETCSLRTHMHYGGTRTMHEAKMCIMKVHRIRYDVCSKGMHHDKKAQPCMAVKRNQRLRIQMYRMHRSPCISTTVR